MSDTCHACGSSDLMEFPGFKDLARVTSDCRPWPSGGRLALCPSCGLVQKVVDNEFHADCKAIYSGYQLYFQGQGSEQRVFDQKTGTSRPRSELVVEHLASAGDLPSSGTMLDIGCGAGHFLATFGSAFPGWELHGLEMDARHEGKVSSLPGVAGFHVGSPAEVGDKFDLVTINHAFEHIPDPASLLADVGELLKDDGLLLIDVPYHPDNPFDLVIADHCSHFSLASLNRLLVRSGFMPLSTTADCIKKEILSVARKGIAQSPLPANSPETVEAILDWLRGFADTARTMDGRPRAVFGTAIAGAWIGGMLGDEVTFFVDEDPNRAGQEFLGKPVLLPSQVQHGSGVFVAFPVEIAEKIAARLSSEAFSLGVPMKLDLPVRENGEEWA